MASSKTWGSVRSALMWVWVVVGCAVLAVLFMSTSNAVIVYIMRSLTVENRTRRPSGACKTEEDILECVCSRYATQFDTHTQFV